LRVLIAVVAAAALGVAGGWLLFNALDEDGSPQETAAAWNTCTNPIQGFSIDYPAAWYTDHRAPELACVDFDPRPFEAPRTGLIATAMEVAIEQAPSDRVEEPAKFEAVEDGMAVYGYRVPAGDREFTVYTTNNAGVEFDAWKTIVDKAVGTMQFTTPVTRPVDGAAIPRPQVGLPEPVARKRAEIWAAARRGDYAAVAALASADGFEYTFGGAVEGGPAAYWRRLEQTTRERPLETLVAILELPYTRDPRSGLYVWPDAFVRRPSTMSPEAMARLTDAVGEETVKAYEEFGSYLGYRAGIDREGDWVFYVAGD
jgi:hypothetical protein